MTLPPARSSTMNRPGVGLIGHTIGGAWERPRLSTVATKRRGNSSSAKNSRTALRPRRSVNTVPISAAFKGSAWAGGASTGYWITGSAGAATGSGTTGTAAGAAATGAWGTGRDTRHQSAAAPMIAATMTTASSARRFVLILLAAQAWRLSSRILFVWQCV